MPCRSTPSLSLRSISSLGRCAVRSGRNRYWGALLAVAVLLIGSAARAQTSTVPGALHVDATQVAAGMEWFITGDSNLNCVVTTSFRPAAGGAWRTGQPLLRVEPGSFNPQQVDPGNLLAGSLFDLAPATDYLVRLVLHDVDGGAADTTVPFRTRDWPRLPANARTRHVVPGSGGGSGTTGDPFRGISAADAAASPGDLFLLAPGVYTGVVDLRASGTPADPIVWIGVSRDQSVIDGQLLRRNAIELQGTHDVQLRNLTVRNPGKSCLSASGTRNIAVIGCRLDFSVRSGWELCGLDFRGNAHENVFVSGNEMTGPLNWAEGRNEDHFGVILVGKGHVVRYNRIHGVYDAVQVGGDRDSVVTSNCDVYGNELYDCTDDGIEFDGSRHNIRCFDNRITNVLTGLSCQPVYGGPIYMLRNVVYNWQLKPLKFHSYPTGMIVVNNTLIGANERGWGGGEWRRAILRNNLILGGSNSGFSGSPICLFTLGQRADLDYDGWYQVLPNRFARFNDVSYPTLQAFQAGTLMEQHGRLVNYGIFVDAAEPALGPYLGVPTYFPPYAPGSANVSLKPGAAAVDAGLALANLNDGWLGAAPDLGAYELGKPVPSYGPAADPVSGIGGTRAYGSALALRISPEPSYDEVRIAWPSSAESEDESGGGTIGIFDATGRRVRRVQELRGSSWRWDGRDDRGREVSAGVYWVRLELAGRIAPGRLVRIHGGR
jgi:hypothetical protein